MSVHGCLSSLSQCVPVMDWRHVQVILLVGIVWIWDRFQQTLEALSRIKVLQKMYGWRLYASFACNCGFLNCILTLIKFAYALLSYSGSQGLLEQVPVITRWKVEKSRPGCHIVLSQITSHTNTNTHILECGMKHSSEKPLVLGENMQPPQNGPSRLICTNLKKVGYCVKHE